MKYSEFLKRLTSYAEIDFAIFQRKLIKTKYEILGVRTQTLRRLAKEYYKDAESIFAFPNEYYETVFIKLTIASMLPCEAFIERLPKCIALMDNWALCDSFKAKCIRKRKEEFLPILRSIFHQGGEYFQRYPLVVLLAEYVEKPYFSVLEEFITSADTSPYYVHMAVAWLIAEILVKEYDFGITLLHKHFIDVKTHNKAIQKAIESYRLTTEQKEYLRSLKIKNKL